MKFIKITNYTKLYSAIHIENRIVFDININS